MAKHSSTHGRSGSRSHGQTYGRRSRKRNPPPSKFDVACLVSLTLIAAITPWFIGGVLSKTLVVVWAAVLLSILVWIAGVALGKKRRAVCPLVAIPPLLGILLGLLQLVPLPQSIASVIQPTQMEHRQQFDVKEPAASEQTPADDAEVAAIMRFPQSIVEDTRISTNPSGTRKMLCLLALVVTTFFLATQVFHRRAFYLFFAGAMSVCGAVLSIFGIIQAVSWNGKLFWLIELTQGGVPFSSFVNRNNAGGFLLMTLGCCLTMTIWVFMRERSDKKVRDATFHELDKLHERVMFVVVRFFAELNGLKVFMILACSLIAGGVIASVSRGSILSLVFASIATLVVSLSYNRRQFALPIIAVTMLGVGTLTGWIGFNEELTARFSIIQDEESLQQEGRVKLWNDLVPAMQDYAYSGSGLGSFRYVNRNYLTFHSSAVFHHAENQYIQTLIEAGVPGLLLLLAAIAGVAYSIGRILRKTSARFFAIGLGACFSFSGELFHSVFDLGTYIPANAILLSIICGGIVGLLYSADRRKSGESREQPGIVGKALRFAAVPVMLLLFSGGVLAVIETYRESQVEAAMYAASFDVDPEDIPIEELDLSIQQLEEAYTRKPTTEVSYRLAELRTLKYRHQFMAKLPVAVPDLARLERDRIWPLTSLSSLHRTLSANRNSNLLETVLSEPVISENLPNALKLYQETLMQCAFQPDAALRLAELAPVEPEAVNEREMLLLAIRLNPGNKHQQFICGVIAHDIGDSQLAAECWNRALSLGSRRIDIIVSMSRGLFDDETFVNDVVPDDHELVLAILKGQLRDASDATRRNAVLEKYLDLLAKSDLQPADHLYLKAQGYVAVADIDNARSAFLQALEKQPYRADWRFEFAKMLSASGMNEEALNQAEQAAADSPRSIEYREYSDRLHKRLFKDVDLDP